jgi:hypothetical protein
MTIRPHRHSGCDRKAKKGVDTGFQRCAKTAQHSRTDRWKIVKCSNDSANEKAMKLTRSISTHSIIRSEKEYVMNSTKQIRRTQINLETSGLRLRLASAACIAGLAMSFGACAGSITIPNADFSLLSNAGSVGGGILQPLGVDIGIGSGGGPWTGSFNGILGLLAPPTLSIDAAAQTATIEGLLGINLAGLVSNGGYISQVLSGTPWVAHKRYTVSTDIDVGGVVDLDVLGLADVGIALRSGNTVLSASTTAAAPLVNLDLLDGSNYRLKLVYDTGATVNGDVNLQLFNLPQGLLTINLLASTTFANIKLNVGAITDANTQVSVSGVSSQGAQINTPFAHPLVAKVTDQGNQPLEGVIVTISSPTSGASADLTSGSTTGRSVEATTNANGEITLSATANGISGCYAVSASVDGVTQKAIFSLRNYTPEQINRMLDSGIDITLGLQDSIYCNGFE